MNDWTQWAQRRLSKPAPAEPKRQAQAGGLAPPPSLPPAGYAWAAHPSAGWVLVALGSAAPPTQAAAPTPGFSAPFPAPTLAPTGPGYQAIPATGVPLPETCMLVKPGDRDTYVEMLSQLPDLAPSTAGFDAMTGNISPSSRQELVSAGVGISNDAPVAYQSPSHRPSRMVADLRR